MSTYSPTRRRVLRWDRAIAGSSRASSPSATITSGGSGSSSLIAAQIRADSAESGPGTGVMRPSVSTVPVVTSDTLGCTHAE